MSSAALAEKRADALTEIALARAQAHARIDAHYDKSEAKTQAIFDQVDSVVSTVSAQIRERIGRTEAPGSPPGA